MRKQPSSFPTLPGVYLFRGKKEEVLYVGKAKNLRARIRQYLKGQDERTQIAFLLKRTENIDYIVTDTEKEALLLENTLIKKHRPRYNIDLKDDKNYISIRLGVEHQSPGLSLTRRILKDGAAYFGPYAFATSAREAVDQATKFFQIRTCTDREFANRIRPCLKYDIGRCRAPCVGKIAPDEYAEQVRDVLAFLKCRDRKLVRRLREKMEVASQEQRYADAARFRDAIQMIEKTLEKQKMVLHRGGDYDALALSRDHRGALISLLIVRHGTLIDQRSFALGKVSGEEEDVLSTFLLQHYLKLVDLPGEILLPLSLEDAADLVNLIEEQHGARVKLTVPKRGVKREMLELAAKNAAELLKQGGDEAEKFEALLERLAQKLHLSTSPHTIECVDISNLQGREAVGSLVCFLDGKPRKDRYRIYNIRTLATPDDYAMMKEVLTRRFAQKRGLESPRSQPDLLLVDGGKGQLGIALKALEEVGVTGLAVAAIAKARNRHESDQIYLPGRKNAVNLKPGSPELLYCMRIRDEAHRFGLKAHRGRRTKQSFR